MAVVIAFGTNNQAYYNLFTESCRRHSIQPVILGWGEKWIGFGKKTMVIRDYIRNLPRDEIVLSVDPFDVVFLSGLEEIETKFRQMDTPFLAGALRLGPFNSKVYDIEFNRTGRPVPDTPSGYKFLNTGTWISRAGYAADLIDRLEKSHHMTETSMEQRLLTGIYIRDKAIVDIDWKCEIFHNLLFRDFLTRRPDLNDIQFHNGRIINTATGSKPCILHASGNTRMRGIAEKLGYNGEVARPVNDTINFTRKAFFHIHQLITRINNHF